MNRKKEIQEELESISPLLAKIDRTETPETPYLYFDKLTDKVLNQVKEKEAPSWWHQILNQLTFKNAIAFASLTIIIVATVLFLQPSDTIELNSFANLEEAAIDDYIASNIDDFEETILYEYVDVSSDPMDFLEVDETEVYQLMNEWIDDVDIETIEEFL